jgi:DNA invertase Pin-like site-specific DNA recombinase
MTLRSRPTPTLPPDLDHVRGLRVARWLRESTPDQMDYYGPAAQTRVIEDAIKRFGLRDTGIGWTVAASGWKRAWLTLEWQEMLAAAREGRFDVLLVAYQSRFLRNVKQTLIAIEDQLHPAGVAIFFIDEGNLSSDPDDWHAIVEEATDAERYSRRMAKRQREGHAAKRRTGEPGGRPPFGFRREGKPPVLVEMPERIDLVRQVFEWSASGLTDRQVAERAQLRKTHVSELLSNRFYAGELSDGTRREPPVIDSELWSQVQEQRSRHARRHPGPVSYRLYRLGGLLACRNCGRLLTGHCGRYRHTEACLEYRAARPGAPDGRVKGESYSAQTYEDPVREAVGRLSANRGLVSEVQAAVAAQAGCAGPDRLALVRVARRRREAADRLTQDRDMARWQAEMEALDVEEAAARAANHAVVSACEVVEYLADLPQLYDDAEPETQKRILQSLIERVEVLGPDQLWIYPTDEAEARGLAAAFAGEFRTKVRQTGRGERSSAHTFQHIVWIDAGTTPLRLVRSA